MARREDRRARRPKMAAPGPSRGPARLAPFLPPLIAVVLALPCFSFGWLWDDYDFLARAQTFRPSYLLPDPGSIYYRPISRELYFAALWHLDHARPILSHVVNAAFLATATWLLVSVATRLVGARAGVLAGIAFASFAAAPVLVGWVSGAQELLATVFLLLALEAQVAGRSLWAVMALGAALLSKETALAALPVVAALPWMIGRRPARPLLYLVPFLALVLGWGIIHPGIHTLLERHLLGQGAGQVGLGSPGRLFFLARSALTLLNLPVQGAATPWPEGRGLALLLALAATATAVLVVRRPGRREARSPAHVPPRGALLACALLAAGPLALAAGLIPIWAPYYCVLPAIGTSILIGLGLSRLPMPAVLAVLGVFAAAGVWSRGASPDPVVPCERNLETTDAALKRVESGFKELHSTLPRGAQMLVSVAGTGSAGVFTHMYRFQVLRVWYADPTLLTLEPGQPRGGEHPVLLMRVTPGFGVVDIDPERMQFKTNSGMPAPSNPEALARFAFSEVYRPLRAYALGLAVIGQVDQAIQIETRLAERESGGIEIYDKRLEAAFLLLAGHEAAGEQLLQATPPWPRRATPSAVAKLLREAGALAGLDQAALRAFGIDPSDVAAVHEVIRQLRDWGATEPALRLARRLQALAPHDSESAEVIRSLQGRTGPDRLTTPVEGFIP